MQVILKSVRKDGKLMVRLGFDSGAWFNKIITKEQYDEYKKESRPVEIHSNGFNNR